MDLSEEDIETFFEANKNDYFIAPYMTFTHVYFEKDKRGDDAALALAEAKLTELNAARVSFAEAPRHGDRFPYFLNYVERDPDFVASHFGPPVAEQLFMLEPDPALWRGPLESPYGYHLVLLTKKVEGRYPDLDEVRERVRSDLEQVEIDTMQDKAIQAIVDTYDVRRTL
jgi:parvulin-like peptidyl-prolyl isomerase